MIPLYGFAAVVLLFVGGYLTAVAWRKYLLRGRACSGEVWLRSFELSPRVTLSLAKRVLGPVATAAGCDVTRLRPSDSLSRSPLVLSGVGELLHPPSDLADALDDAIREALGDAGLDAVHSNIKRVGDDWTLGDVMRAVDAFVVSRSSTATPRG